MEKNIVETPKIGDILKEEFLEPLNISAYRLAKEINVSTSSVLDLIHNKRKISVEMALRLARYFGTSSKFWLNLQNEIDLRETNQKLKKELYTIIAHHSHTDYEKVWADSDRDYWMTSEEAKEYGMIDQILCRKPNER